MGNPMKYVKVLEAAGFERGQAEAQVQVVLDALEGDLVTKGEFAIFQERLDNRFARIDERFAQIDNRFIHVDNRFSQLQNYLESQIRESEFRVVTRLGIVTVSVVTVAVAVLTWLIKV